MAPITLKQTDMHTGLYEVSPVPKDKSDRQNLVSKLRGAAKREGKGHTVSERDGRVFVATSEAAAKAVPKIEGRGRGGLSLSELVEKAEKS